MPIMCNSPMRADPLSISLPGGATLSFDAVANPVTTDADVVYTIVPSSAGVCFANGTKRDQRRQRVSAAGTTISHQARFVRCVGATVAAFEVRAEVSEASVPQCSRTATLGVRAVDEMFSLDVETLPAPEPRTVKKAARRKRANKGKKKAKAPKGRARKKKGGRKTTARRTRRSSKSTRVRH